MKKKNILILLLSATMICETSFSTFAYANEINEKQLIEVEQPETEKQLAEDQSVEGKSEEDHITKKGKSEKEKQSTEESQQTEVQSVNTKSSDSPALQAQGTTVYVNGIENGNDTNTGTSDKPVQSLTKAIELAGENGTVIIQNTVSIAGNVVLDNNVTIKRGGNCSGGMIYLDEGSLTINRATIDGNKGEYPAAGRIIRIMGESELTINDGAKICNNAGAAIEQISESSSGEGSLFTMNGGEIYNIGNGNSEEDSHNEGVVLLKQKRGRTIINGGSIHDNTMTALYTSNYLFRMTGGKIYNNTYEGDYQTDASGGICIANGIPSPTGYEDIIDKMESTISGGEIYNNTSEFGGAITVGSRTTMTITGDVSIHDNTSSYGGGVYIKSGKLNMEGGKICNNTGTVMGGGIFLWTQSSQQPSVHISGGEISGNMGDTTSNGVDTYRDDGNPNCVVELSGAPTIKDPIKLNDWQDNTAKIDIVAEFNPTQAVPVHDAYWTEGRVIVSYKDGLTARKSDFVKFNKTGTQDILQDGQNLKSTNIAVVEHDVTFKEEDGSTLYKTIKVTKDDKIKESDIPTVTKKGYTLTGWKSVDGVWDFETNTVTGNTELYPIWKLDKPVNGALEAEGNITTVHSGNSVTLRVTTNHEAEGDITYSYEWYKDGIVIPSKTRAAQGTDELQASESGQYSVKVKASDGTLVSEEAEYGPIEITVTDHDFSGEWEKDATNHWHICQVADCDVRDGEAAHTYSEWNVVREATTTEKGSRERSCTVCGYKETEEIPELPEAEKYGVTYTFISGTKNQELPQEVLKLLPTDETKYETGTKVKGKTPAETTVKTKDGVWTFAGYDAEEKVIAGDTTFTGVWNYKKNEEKVNHAPVIEVKDQVINVGDQFDAKSIVKAFDEEDGDLTDKVEIIKNTVDTTKAGAYEVTYQVTDSQGASTLATITVKVTAKSPDKTDDKKDDSQDQNKDNKSDGNKETIKKEEKVTVTTVNTSASSVKTGDHANVIYYIALVGISFVAGVIVYLKKKRKWNN